MKYQTCAMQSEKCPLFCITDMFHIQILFLYLEERIYSHISGQEIKRWMDHCDGFCLDW